MAVRGKEKNGRPLAADGSRSPALSWLTIVGARHNNLKNLTVDIPLARFVCVTGVSGSGKSSLVNDILHQALAHDLNGATEVDPGEHDRIDGLEHLDKIINIDQSAIGRTPRSNPATYIKVFDEIRSLFARLPDSKVRGYKPGRFSFNVSAGKEGGGRCEACEGYGANKMEMEFLADLWVTCPTCNGSRFNHETLQILFKGKSISDVLNLDVQQALEHFANVPSVETMLQTLHDVGLDYVKLGQSSTTLSGGEAQRIKLARELAKKSTGRTMYVLDEPTTGLHFDDIRKLLTVLHGFVDAGNSVVVIEHNLDVIKTADWVIDLGPEGGAAGGQVVAIGTPEDIAQCDESFTGAALAPLFAGNGRSGSHGIDGARPRKASRGNGESSVAGSPTKKARGSTYATDIEVFGAKQHNLKGIDVTVPRGSMTVCCGPSGSGKSSFAVDTVYVEGQRRYVESLSAYARQFLGRFQPARVDHIRGLSPAICIEQRTTSRSPRSTVGTITEIYDYMRVLWARIGQPFCPRCNESVGAQSADEIVEKLIALGEGKRLLLLAPIEPVGQETHVQLLQREAANGFVRARINGVVRELADTIEIDTRRKNQIELIVDRVTISSRQRARLTDSVEQALRVGQGVMLAQVVEDSGGAKGGDLRFSRHHACMRCGVSYEELTPHHFSFNSRLGWCEACEGLGMQKGANPASIVVQPTKSIVGGALTGWGVVEPNSLLYRMASALADHIGFDVDRPWNELTETQRQRLFHGLPEDWIEVADVTQERSKTKSAGDQTSSFRFRWRGFYPAIHRATQISLAYRFRLDEMVVDVACERCLGSRIRPDAAAVQVGGKSMGEVCQMSLGAALAWFDSLKLAARDRKVAGELLHEVRSRLRFLVDVGLHYVTLHRTASTLSGGESQRIQLASQIGTGLTGVLYVLDEPTIGLHPRDNTRLIGALQKLRNLGNTLLLVEHDREVIESCDHLLDFGPGAGSYGGEVTAAGTPRRVSTMKSSLTGRYLSGALAIAVPTNRRPVGNAPRLDVEETDDADFADAARHRQSDKWLVVHRARENNLKEVDVAFPLGRFVCVTGVSGSGKSTLVSSVLRDALRARIHRAAVTAGAHDRITGIEHIDKVIDVDQAPIGITPTSNPATYTGVFDALRELFAKLPLSKMRGYTANRFSFNRAGGRCEACQGMGSRCIEMHFLPDVWVECENCQGKRYTTETLDVRYRDKNIADVLGMAVADALQLFENVPKLQRMLQTLDDVGLGYVQLGQAANTLSGGEAQRVKLAAELGRPSTGKTLYILDEPTTGLHFDDLKKLLGVLHRLVDLGNTCICIEHNLDVIKTADWLIDLGPEGGHEGGFIVASGTPEEIAKSADSHTGTALRPVLEAGPHESRTVYEPHKPAKRKPDPSARIATGGVVATDELSLADDLAMPWNIDGRKWHLENPKDSKDSPVHWDPKLLEWLVDTMQSLGQFDVVDWNHRTKVELLTRGAPMWFCHILTGGGDLLEVSLRVGARTFVESKLQSALGVKSLDERTDLPIYGQDERVRVRTKDGGWQDVQLSLRDFKDVNRTAFKSFLREAAASYARAIQQSSQSEDRGKPWEADGQAWHMAQRAIGRRGKPRWKSDTLLAMIGRFKTIDPRLEIDWSGKVMVRLRKQGESQHGVRIITNMPRGLRIEVRVRRGLVTPTQIERLGEDSLIKPCGDIEWIVFWLENIADNDAKQLRQVWSLGQLTDQTETARSA